VTEAEWIAFLQRPEIPAFNRAMLVNPDDDLPRLVFADWMDENCPDEFFNRFIRESITSQESIPFRVGYGNQRRRLSFDRGRVFASLYSRSPPPKRREPRTLFAAVWRAQWVNRLALDGVGPKCLKSFFHDPPMAMVRGVYFHENDCSPALLPEILNSSHLTHLTYLSLSGRASTELLRALLSCEVVVQFTGIELTVADNVSTAGLIANSPKLTGLSHMRLHGCRSADFAAALANSPYLCEAIRAQWRRATDEGGANR